MTDAECKPEGARPIAVGGELRTCPECGYRDGFHNMFRPCERAGQLDWLLICPSCSAVFDAGLKVAAPASS